MKNDAEDELCDLAIRLDSQAAAGLLPAGKKGAQSDRHANHARAGGPPVPHDAGDAAEGGGLSRCRARSPQAVYDGMTSCLPAFLPARR